MRRKTQDVNRGEILKSRLLGIIDASIRVLEGKKEVDRVEAVEKVEKLTWLTCMIGG